MSSVVGYIVVLAMFIQTAQSGIMTFAICQATCTFLAATCMAAVTGGTAGAGVAAGIFSCKAVEAGCLVACHATTP